jgi:23S rRNA (cytosine1962-C5)-methyltransferase
LTKTRPQVVLRKPLRAAVAAGHPWIWRDATQGSEHAPGTVVTVVDGKGRFVGRGVAESGPIAVRVWTADDEAVGPGMLARRIADALALRQRVVLPETTAWRLLHGEGDRIPGIVCDVYGEVASIALDGAAALAWRDPVLEALRPVLDRLGVASAMLRTGRRGERTVEHVWGPVPPDPLTIVECGTKLVASVWHGQKTGMFLDHRTARARIRELCHGARVLDLYAYVGGFSANAGRGGAARVDTVDVAPEAIAAANRAWAANELPDARHATHVADVPEFLAAAHAAKRQWDVIIADPPSFAPNESSKDNALRSYALLHAACAKVLVRGGLLLAASCSSHVDAAAFEEALAHGSARARRIVQVLDRWGAPADHPRLLAFPEGDYLKVVLARLG